MYATSIVKNCYPLIWKKMALLLEKEVKLESTLHGYNVTVRLGLCISIVRALLVDITRTNTVSNGKDIVS